MPGKFRLPKAGPTPWQRSWRARRSPRPRPTTSTRTKARTRTRGRVPRLPGGASTRRTRKPCRPGTLSFSKGTASSRGIGRPRAPARQALRSSSAPTARGWRGLRPGRGHPKKLAAITLFNQDYWTIRDLETVGGNTRGIFVSGNVANGLIRGISILDCYAHEVGGESTVENDKDNGCIILSTGFSNNTQFKGALIEGCEAAEPSAGRGS